MSEKRTIECDDGPEAVNERDSHIGRYKSLVKDIRVENKTKQSVLAQTLNCRKISKDLLLQSMVFHDVKRICLQIDDENDDRHNRRITATVRRGANKYISFESIDQIIGYAHDLIYESKVSTIVANFLDRVRIDASPNPPYLMLSITTEQTKPVVEISPLLPQDLKRLALDAARAEGEYVNSRLTICQLRKEKRAVEVRIKKCTDVVPGSITVATAPPTKLPSDIRQEQPAAVGSGRLGIGIRKISACVKKAAQECVKNSTHHDFLNLLKLLLEKEIPAGSLHPFEN